MNLEEQYTRILEKEKEKELIPFLQSLSEQERRSLTPTIKKLARDYFAFVQQGSTWSSKATEKQGNILYYAMFVCYNKKEIEKENPVRLIDRAHLEKFLSWYCPSWLSDYINGFASRDWIPYSLDYGYLVELWTRGFLQPSPELIAKTLVPYVYEQEPKSRETYFRPERLEHHAITLQEHIWHVFEYETNLHFSNRYLYSESGRVQKSWVDVFTYILGDGKIDRARLLEEALLASNRNFNKNLSGWFAELFMELTPTTAETIILQPVLFNLFAAPHSKVVTTALAACKTIVDDPAFDAENFLNGVPLLLSSSTKSVVTTTLQLLEKLAKKREVNQSAICGLAANAFVHKEETLQTRAAKLIQKFGEENDESLKQTLHQYKDNLFSQAKDLLQPFLTDEAISEEKQVVVPVMPQAKGMLTEETSLPTIHDVDELVFLCAQAFDNNESWHIDHLPSALAGLQHQIKGHDIPKLEPAIQRALKLYFGEWRSHQGRLDYLLACFFLDCSLVFMSRFPEHSGSARKLFASFMDKHEENKKLWQEYGTSVSFFAGWKAEGDSVIYSAHTRLLSGILSALRTGQTLPILSTPTHAPGWINPTVLVERLSQYQAQNAPPDEWDLQVALSRCWLHGTTDATRLANEKLTGELKAILLFLLDGEQRPSGPITLESAWMTAALSKSPHTIYPELGHLSYNGKPRELYTGQYPFEVLLETYTYDKYNWEGGKLNTVKATAQRKVIKLDLSAQNPRKQPESGLKKFFSKLTGSSKEEVVVESTPLLYDYLRIPARWLSTEERDIRRIYLLTPNNPEPLLALTIDKCLSDPAFYGETAKRFVVQVLQVLHETWRPMGEIGHLFVATCLLSEDKTAATYAAECWLSAVEEESIESRLLGESLGRLERIEFAPLKRFTDLVVKCLLNASPLHNKALEQVLSSMLIELPELPVKGLKKLLEIYLEVTRLNGSGVQDEALKAKLRQWKENSGLGKTLKVLG